MSSEQAQAAISALENQLAAASATEVELANEARRISYSALSDGDEGAKKALAKIDADVGKLRQTQQHLRDALEEARRRLGESERAAERERMCETAAAAMQFADDIAARGKRLDAAFAIAREELEGFKADLDGLHRLGLNHPRGELFRVNGGRALATSLMGLPLKTERDHLAPRERISWSSLADGWAAGVRNWAAPFLEKANAEAAE
jgi:hypothetical protein